MHAKTNLSKCGAVREGERKVGRRGILRRWGVRRKVGGRKHRIAGDRKG